MRSPQAHLRFLTAIYVHPGHLVLDCGQSSIVSEAYHLSLLVSAGMTPVDNIDCSYRVTLKEAMD